MEFKNMMSLKNLNIKFDLWFLAIAVILLIVFIVVYYTVILKRLKESFENAQVDEKKVDETNKSCSEQSINSGFLNYIFGGAKSIR
jgi:Ca2+/Na+ antiporter